MKQFISVMMAVTTAVSLAGCGTEKKQSDTGAAAGATEHEAAAEEIVMTALRSSRSRRNHTMTK